MSSGIDAGKADLRKDRDWFEKFYSKTLQDEDFEIPYVMKCLKACASKYQLSGLTISFLNEEEHKKMSQMPLCCRVLWHYHLAFCSFPRFPKWSTLFFCIDTFMKTTQKEFSKLSDDSDLPQKIILCSVLEKASFWHEEEEKEEKGYIALGKIDQKQNKLVIEAVFLNIEQEVERIKERIETDLDHIKTYITHKGFKELSLEVLNVKELDLNKPDTLFFAGLFFLSGYSFENEELVDDFSSKLYKTGKDVEEKHQAIFSRLCQKAYQDGMIYPLPLPICMSKEWFKKTDEQDKLDSIRGFATVGAIQCGRRLFQFKKDKHDDA